MLNSSWLTFIEEHILKRGEQLEAPAYGHFSTLIDFTIIKRTARTYRKLGILTISKEIVEAGNNIDLFSQDLPDKSLLKWSPGKKAELQDDDSTFQLLKSGWIIKELRLKKDGKTVESIHFRMGLRLFLYQQHLANKAKETLNQELNSYKQAVRIQFNAQTFFSGLREERLTPLIKVLEEICAEVDLVALETYALFPRSWTINKRLHFLTFVLALIRISSQKKFYDWKEIGATYFKKIGGSKFFDSQKDEFIALVDEWAGRPTAMLGLVSLGKITPLYFSGHLSGQFSSYSWGLVHALTDLSIAQESFKTGANTLWLVENRAILTRMAYEEGFLFNTHSLIVSVDGHLRSAHKAFIHQVLKNSSISQVIMWSDYDHAGLQIAGEMYQTVSSYNIKTKWIRPDQQVETCWEDYQIFMEAFLKEEQIEQEQVLGSVEVWNKWISL